MKRIGILMLLFFTCFALKAWSQAQASDHYSDLQWVSAWQGSPTPEAHSTGPRMSV